MLKTCSPWRFESSCGHQLQTKIDSYDDAKRPPSRFINKHMKYTCHSGGCKGSDIFWELVGKEYGVHTISYSFSNHKQCGENPKVLTVDELLEGWEHVLKANETLKRNPQNIPYNYTKNLLSRNWFQVKNSDVIFAIGFFDTFAKVKGGTGWAVQMGIDNKKPIYFFDQNLGVWTYYNYKDEIFLPLFSIPQLVENFAGIGTRELLDNGMTAITEIYKQTFELD